MYIISDTIQVNTPTLIDILCNNGYDIINDGHGVEIKTPSKTRDYISNDDIKSYLTLSNNKLYKYFKRLEDNPKLEYSSTDFAKKLAKEREAENAKTLNLLLYYTGISLLAHKDKQIISLVARIKEEREEDKN